MSTEPNGTLIEKLSTDRIQTSQVTVTEYKEFTSRSTVDRACILKKTVTRYARIKKTSIICTIICTIICNCTYIFSNIFIKRDNFLNLVLH